MLKRLCIVTLIIFAFIYSEKTAAYAAMGKAHWRHSWEPIKKSGFRAETEKPKPVSAQDFHQHWLKLEAEELRKAEELSNPGWIWIRIPKILILIPAIILALLAQALMPGQPKKLEWIKVRVIRETQRGLRVEGASRDFWLPKSRIVKMKMSGTQMKILIPIWLLP
jgi:hypothetical protein